MNRKNAKCVGEVEKCSDDSHFVRDKTAMCYLGIQVCAKKVKDEWARIYNSVYTCYSLGYKGICESTKIM